MSVKSPEEIQHIVDGLGYDFSQFELSDFVQFIEKRRNRRIIPRPWTLEWDVSGVWIKASHVELVFYNSQHNPLLQTHGILHEIGHMVLEHKPIPLSEIIAPEILEEFRREGGSINGFARKFPKERQPLPEEFEAEWFVFALQKRVLNFNRIKEFFKLGSTVAVFKPYADGMGFDD